MKGTVANNKRPRNEKTAGRREKNKTKKHPNTSRGRVERDIAGRLAFILIPRDVCALPDNVVRASTQTHTKRLREERMGGLVKVASRSVRAASALVTDAWKRANWPVARAGRNGQLINILTRAATTTRRREEEEEEKVEIGLDLSVFSICSREKE